ncbi:MAG TPA: bacterioferritin [Chloroflexota bacterium]|nr:bacterioferritin [Chloroflexota bacterium]
MQAKEGVVDYLNRLLTNELTAINQYFLQAEICENWGFPRLYRELKRLAIEEMREAEELIEHILYFEGLPNLQRLGQIRVGENVQEHLEAALELEKGQNQLLTEAIDHCSKVGDYTTRTILERKIEGEKAHIDWVETELETIGHVGLPNYLAQQIKKADD